MGTLNANGPLGRRILAAQRRRELPYHRYANGWYICARAVETRDCPLGHRWSDTEPERETHDARAQRRMARNIKSADELARMFGAE